VIPKGKSWTELSGEIGYRLRLEGLGWKLIGSYLWPDEKDHVKQTKTLVKAWARENHRRVLK